MRALSLPLSPDSFAAVIDAYGRAALPDLAIEAFNRLPRFSCPQTTPVYNTISLSIPRSPASSLFLFSRRIIHSRHSLPLGFSANGHSGRDIEALAPSRPRHGVPRHGPPVGEAHVPSLPRPRQWSAKHPPVTAAHAPGNQIWTLEKPVQLPRWEEPKRGFAGEGGEEGRPWPSEVHGSIQSPSIQ